MAWDITGNSNTNPALSVGAQIRYPSAMLIQILIRPDSIIALFLLSGRSAGLLQQYLPLADLGSDCERSSHLHLRNRAFSLQFYISRSSSPMT